jgi:hypothetical protein
MNKNFGGRTPGAVNKITSEARQTLKLIFDDEIVHLRANLQTLSTKDRIDVILKIMPFLLPKLATETIIPEPQKDFHFDFQVDVLENVNDEFVVTNTYKRKKDE